MIQAIGLTSTPQRGRPPAVDDLTFEARPGRVTVLLGPSGAGKSTTLRLMLQLRPGRGVALFRGRPLHQVPHPSREVGTLLGDVPGHPGRSARSHLRMLAAASGVPLSRADDVLDVVGLSGLADQKLGIFSRGMDRRLGLGAALLGDPHTLVLDQPACGLSPREAAWLHGLLRGYADQGGAVLLTDEDSRRAARVADRVVSLEAGRLVADQEAADFGRTRLRPRVAVRTPHAGRLAAALEGELRTVRPGEGEGPAEVVQDSGSRLLVYGSSCGAVGEIAYRHRVLVHQLADEEGGCGDQVLSAPLARADGRSGSPTVSGQRQAVSRRSESSAASLPPRLPAVSPPGPSWPLRYEFLRWSSTRGGWWTVTLALLAGLLASTALALTGSAPAHRLLSGWFEPLPLPPAALAAGLLGALSFGQEFRHPALAPAQVPVPRRLGLLLAKALVSAVVAVLLCCATVAVNSIALILLLGEDVAQAFSATGTLGPAGAWAPAIGGAVLLTVACAWAGLLAAGIFRCTLAGLAAVGMVPLLVAPLLRVLLNGPVGRVLEGLPERFGSLTTLPLPSAFDRWMPVAASLAAQPVGWAFALALGVLLGGYTLIGLRTGPR